ncbi:5-formyltetrahydrofolate cyclo-ligase [Aquibacillus sediminis]|uniref:5-formyltetrahydrofolate cyclo-ligase n=1 Tax=Aquibacillus sediminis TaxID=2574734 RepID=UPI0011081615|nr:5-formyltetrahydrofolate cyclo-ligase [Aquibacillus sediminis]
MTTKAEYRNKMKKQLKQLSIKKKTQIEQRLSSQLFATEAWKEADVIGITISQKHEWNTKNIIEKAWSMNKVICVPKCYPKESKLEFYQLDSFDQLESVYFNLFEPIPEQERRIDKNQVDLMIVPGLVFDPSGFRIGYGGGYYDRYLADFGGTTLSLASTMQIIDTVPADDYDISVDHVLTETGLLHKE